MKVSAILLRANGKLRLTEREDDGLRDGRKEENFDDVSDIVAITTGTKEVLILSRYVEEFNTFSFFDTT